LDALRAVRAARNPDQAQLVLADELPESVAAVLYPGELEPLLQRLRALPEPSARPRLTRDDWLGAFGISASSSFHAARHSTISFCGQTCVGLTVSNLIAIGLLFLTGYIFSRNLGHDA
jgi:hypothetical protein